MGGREAPGVHTTPENFVCTMPPSTFIPSFILMFADYVFTHSTMSVVSYIKFYFPIYRSVNSST